MLINICIIWSEIHETFPGRLTEAAHFATGWTYISENTKKMKNKDNYN